MPKRLIIATIGLVVATAFPGNAKAQCDGNIVAAWKVTNAEVLAIGVVEIRLHDVEGVLYIEEIFKDGGSTLLRVRREGSALYYEQHAEVIRVGGEITMEV